MQQKLAAVASGVLTAAQWALNAAMSANPIGLIVIGIAALAAGFVYAYTHSETFRAGVDAVTGALKDAFGWVKDHWPLLLAILTGPIGLAVLAIATHWDTIRSTTEGVVGAITGFLAGAWGTIKNAASTAWNAVKDAILGALPGHATSWAMC